MPQVISYVFYKNIHKNTYFEKHLQTATSEKRKTKKNQKNMKGGNLVSLFTYFMEILEANFVPCYIF